MKKNELTTKFFIDLKKSNYIRCVFFVYFEVIEYNNNKNEEEEEEEKVCYITRKYLFLILKLIYIGGRFCLNRKKDENKWIYKKWSNKIENFRKKKISFKTT